MVIRSILLKTGAGLMAFAGAAAFAGVTPQQAAGLVPIGYEVCEEPICDDAGQSCVPGYAGSGACGSQCSDAECDSTLGRFRSTLRSTTRAWRREHYRDSIDQCRHLHHPTCPPFCAPAWGYHQTCWQRFPEEALWCPQCPTGMGAYNDASYAPVPAPPAVLPPPAPAAGTPQS